MVYSAKLDQREKMGQGDAGGFLPVFPHYIVTSSSNAPVNRQSLWFPRSAWERGAEKRQPTARFRGLPQLPGHGFLASAGFSSRGRPRPAGAPNGVRVGPSAVAPRKIKHISLVVCSPKVTRRGGL